ncbi:hypothetical protein CALCODRAFT_434231 [Calocera cornea HHB12733]|uniref:DNA-directed RNA polymerase III subunit Rpc5 n=1 Tax=Calocera cornea HHB12733 TaxID=1353952 RepID=A0A165FZL6_9BASI|nr:hypothetical protein CALCODRAFT_434231 [Calocera cornea HHB12733]
MDVDPDAPIATIPIHLSNSLAPYLSIHQFPLLTQLRVPTSAEAAGRRIKARHKPKTGIVEVRLPLDTRTDVFDAGRGFELGVGREAEDAESSSTSSRRKRKARDDDDASKPLDEVRLVSQHMKGTKQRTTNMIGVLRGDKLYLHPLERTYQLRPSLDYLDALAAKEKESRRGRGDEDDEEEEEEGETRVKRDVREVIGTVKGSGTDKEFGGMSTVRKEMLVMMRDEKEEKWHDLEWNDANAPRANELYESLFPHTEHVLKSATNLGDVLRSIKGLSEPTTEP